MSQSFPEFFNSLQNVDVKNTTSLVDTYSGTVFAGREYLTPITQINTLSNISLGPSVYNSDTNEIYVIAYNQSPNSLLLYRYNLNNKQYSTPIALSFVDIVNKLVLSPDNTVLFIISESNIRRLNLTNFTDLSSINTPSVKDIIFTSNKKDAYVAGDRLYKYDVQELCLLANPTNISFLTADIQEFQITADQKKLVFIDKQILGPNTAKYNLGLLETYTGQITNYEIYNGLTNLATSITPSNIVIKDNNIFFLSNSFSSSKIIKFDINLQFFTEISIPPGNLENNVLKDIIEYNNILYLSHGTTTSNNDLLSNNKIYTYDLNLNFIDSITLPKEHCSGKLKILDNCLYNFPLKTGKSIVARYLLNQNTFIQNLNLNLNTFDLEIPKFTNNYCYFVNYLGQQNSLILLDTSQKQINFGTGTNVLIIDGSNALSCLENGILISGGPFNESNPYILTSTDKYAEIYLQNNAVVTYDDTVEPYLNLSASKVISIDNTSKITANYLGLYGGEGALADDLGLVQKTASNGQGIGSGLSGAPGSPISPYGGFGGSGSGHVDIGGSSYQRSGGVSYGDKLFNLIELGAGGGGGNIKSNLSLCLGGNGGRGGGAVVLSSPLIILDGSIEAKGQDGSDGLNFGGGGGAGAGGSVCINAITLSGSSIRAVDTSGGSGGKSLGIGAPNLDTSLGEGGTGSKGRLLVNLINDNSTITSTSLADIFINETKFIKSSKLQTKIIDTFEDSPVEYVNFTINGVNIKGSVRCDLSVNPLQSTINFPTNIDYFATNFSYIPNQNELLVFLDNKLLLSGIDYIELNSTQIQLVNPPTQQSKLSAVTLSNSDIYFDSNLSIGVETNIFAQLELSEYFLNLNNQFNPGFDNIVIFKNNEYLHENQYLEINNQKLKIYNTNNTDNFSIFTFDKDRITKKFFLINSNTRELEYSSYLVNSGNLLVFKNGLLLEENQYQQSNNVIRFTNSLQVNDKITLIELRLSNASVEFSDALNSNSTFTFNKKDVDQLNKRFYKYKLNIQASNTVSPYISETEMEIINSSSKGYIDLRLKDQAIGSTIVCQPEWTTFNLVDTSLTINPKNPLDVDKFIINFNNLPGLGLKTITKFLTNNPVIDTETTFKFQPFLDHTFEKVTGPNILVFVDGELVDYPVVGNEVDFSSNPQNANQYISGIQYDPSLINVQNFIGLNSIPTTVTNDYYGLVFLNGKLLNHYDDYILNPGIDISFINPINGSDKITLIEIDNSVICHKDEIPVTVNQYDISIYSQNLGGSYLANNKNHLLFNNGYFIDLDYGYKLQQIVNSNITVPIPAIGKLDLFIEQDAEITIEGNVISDPNIVDFKTVLYCAVDKDLPELSVKKEVINLVNPFQEIIKLTESHYCPNSNNILVFKDGLLLNPVVDYDQTNTKTIKLLNPSATLSEVVIQILPLVKSFEYFDFEIISNTTEILLNDNSENILIYKNGLLQRKNIDYIQNNETISSSNFNIGDRILVLSFDINKVEIKSVSKISTNLYQKDFIDTNIGFNLQNNTLQVYKNQILFSGYSESEAFSVLLNSIESKNDVISLVYLNFIQGNISNNPETLIFDHELANTVSKLEAVGFIREDFIIEETPISNDINLQRIKLYPQEKSLLFQNGLLLSSNQDYVKNTNLDFTLINPLTNSSNLDIITTHTQERKDLIITDNLITSYDVPFDSTLNNNVLVFRNGQLLNKEVDYTQVETTYEFLISLENNDNLSFVRFGCAEFNNQLFIPSSLSNIILSDKLFRASGTELIVFRNGVLLRPVEDYIENEGGSISLINYIPSLSDYYNLILIRNVTQKNERTSLNLIANQSNVVFTSNYDFSSQNLLVFKNETPGSFQNPVLEREEQLALSTQTVFPLNTFTYTLGNNSLVVFKNGMLQLIGVDYNEIDSSTIGFVNPQNLNDKITFIKLDVSICQTEYVSAVNGSDTILFTTLTYSQNNPNSIIVFRNGVIQEKGIDYNQINTNTIQFSSAFGINETIVGISSDTFGFESDTLSENETNITTNNVNFNNYLNKILVFRDEQLQILNTDYTIVDDNTINFIQSLPYTTKVYVVGILNNAIFSSKLKLLEYSDYTEQENKIIPNVITQGDEYSIIQLSPGIVSTKETYIATGGETILSFNNFNHIPTQQRLWVFKNGELQSLGIDYQEVDNQYINFVNPLILNDKIQFIHLSPSQLIFNTENVVPLVPTSSYKLKSFSYKENATLVFKNNLLLSQLSDYNLQNDFSINFNVTVNSGEQLTFVGSNLSQVEEIQGSNSPVITLATFSYVVNANQLLVFKNGILQNKNTDYQESSPTTLIFNVSILNTDIITVLKATQILRKDITVTNNNPIILNEDFDSRQFLIIKNNNLLLIPNVDYEQLGLNKISLFVNPIIGDTYSFIDLTNKNIPVSASFLNEDYNITVPQSGFITSNFNFVTGNNSLLVFGNKKLYTLTQDYLEKSANEFSLLSPAAPGDILNTFAISASSDAVSSTVSIKNFTYEPQENNLLVYLDGKLLLENLQYDETSTTTVEFNLNTKELVFKNGILLSRLVDYSKNGSQQFNFVDQLENDDAVQVIYCKSQGFFNTLITVTEDLDDTYSLNFNYNPNSLDLIVFKNGVYQLPNIDYFEISNNQIQFDTQELEQGDVINCFHVSSIGTMQLDTQTSTLNQSLFTLPFIYNTNRLLVFKEGVLQTKGIDYNEPTLSSISFIEPLTDGEIISFILLNTNDSLFRYIESVDSVTNLLSTSVDLSSITEQPLTINSLINFFKIDKDLINRVDVTAPTQSYFADAVIENPNNVLVFKNNVLLRPNNEFKAFTSGIFFIRQLQTTDIVSVFDFNQKITFDYEESIAVNNQIRFKFNIPLRTNTFDYWLYLNGQLLTKDVDYIEIDTHTVLFTNAVSVSGDIISLVSFRENLQQNIPILTLNSPAISGNYIKSIDFSNLNEKVLKLANIYGLKLNQIYDNPSPGAVINSDFILDSKNILKFINRRENSISNFSQVDDELFVSDPVNANNINPLVNILNQTLNAAPNSNNFCIPTAELNLNKLSSPNSVTGIIPRITNTPFILEREEQVASNNQSIFTLGFTYTPGLNELFIFVNGILVSNSLSFNDYVETNLSTVTFTNPLPVNTRVTFIKINPSLVVKTQTDNPTIGTNNITVSPYTTSTNEIFPFRNGLLQDLNPLLIDNSFNEISNTQLNFGPNFVSNETITSLNIPTSGYERFTTTLNQTTITSNIYDLAVLNNKALIFRNGQLQILNADYTISGSKSLTFMPGKLYNNDIIIILGDQTVKFIYESIFSNYNSTLDSELDNQPLQYFVDSEDFTAL